MEQGLGLLGPLYLQTGLVSQTSMIMPNAAILYRYLLWITSKVFIHYNDKRSKQYLKVFKFSSVVDPRRLLVTVGAGATVSSVLKELQKHGLTLQNFSSIQEQQIAGWTQVAAHGTGCSLPTVDEMIQRMTVVYPSGGLLTFSKQDSSGNNFNQRLFDMTRVGLGSLGVVSELTLSCSPAMRLRETLSIESTATVAHKHYDRLTNYRHVRYMWMPFTSTVAVVVSNPCHDPTDSELSTVPEGSLPTKPLIDLLLTIKPEFNFQQASSLSFSQLRDLLIDYSPLNVDHIRRVNQAEAAFWQQSTGSRTADSTEILGFDCGGEQLVYEVCFSIGSLKEQSHKDTAFVKELLQLIEDNNIPAACPIEQRWTARSTAPMSPAYSNDPEEVFTWVGVIMYLPSTQTDLQRLQIKRKFDEYTTLMAPLLKKYNATVHWAKIELPADDSPTYKDNLKEMKERLKTRGVPVDEFNRWRRLLDPNGILSNQLIDTLFDRRDIREA
eukprot:CAMPEP_0170132252 /NCGR_PEP_ID=MMETSP0020_2-20130122/23753_1 /TAXON_ID=98059 /ORGANISM="Dinobryon sp., Strain UTEXLB2267" /LENGTH=495 /DNA_ID=CAMNT_0010367523 /DNA_START=279 /DNA_END=1763 /DNA_ORIENTATION=+